MWWNRKHTPTPSSSSLPSSLKLLNVTLWLVRMSKQCNQGHNDTTRAVNFHLTMTMREGEGESQGEIDILSSQQMSVIVENVMSLSLSICQTAVTSVYLFSCLSFSHSLSDFLQDIYTEQHRWQDGFFCCTLLIWVLFPRRCSQNNSFPIKIL